MKAVYLFVVFLLITFAPSASSQSNPIIRSISFSGNNNISATDLLFAIKSKPQTAYDPMCFQKDLETISGIYFRRGYYFVKAFEDSIISIPEDQNIDITVNIYEGEQCRVGELIFYGNNKISTDTIRSVINFQVNDIFSPADLETDMENILQIYDESGYPYASAEVKQIKPAIGIDSAKLLIEINIDEGEFVTIDEIRIAGNKSTKDDVIIRELNLKPNEPFRFTKIRSIKSKLQRLNLFDQVEEPKLFAMDNNHGILIKVTEGNTNTFDGILGYNPKKGDRNASVTGFINISMRNLFGTGRKLHLLWKKESQLTQEIGIRYTEPWMFNIPLSLGGAFQQRKEDTLYIKRAVEVNSDFKFTESISVGGLVKQEFITPSATAQNIAGVYQFSGGLNIVYDTRDDRITPTDGIFYQTIYEVGSTKINDKTSAIQRIGIDVEAYCNILQSQIIKVGLYGRTVNCGNIQLSDLYRFGGTNTLRGYRENEFIGSRIFWSNIEYRFIAAPRSFFYGFIDLGYYYKPLIAADKIFEKGKYGYGIGTRIQTTIGLLGLSFAFGEGDSFLQGKIHIGLINEF
jgi:outer membrane protein insertion porin family